MAQRSRVPKYRRHSTGQAFVEHRGRRHYLGQYDSPISKLRYSRFVAELAQAPIVAEQSLGKPSDDITISELIERYWLFAQTYYRKGDSPSTELKGLEYALSPLQNHATLESRNFGPFALPSPESDQGRC